MRYDSLCRPRQALCRVRSGLPAGLCLALSLWLLPIGAGASEPSLHAEHPVALTAKPRIGRIFFSPSQRRSHRTNELATAQRPSPDQRAASSDRLLVSGTVSSDVGARAVWINGSAVDNASGHRTAWTDRSGRVWLSQGAQGIHLLQPGQSISRGGTIEDLLPAGSVTRH
jgi:hypothetical protein